MSKCLYMTNYKPTRRNMLLFTAWLKDHFSDCRLVEFNVGKKTHPGENRGGYQGRVEGPPEWESEGRADDRRTVVDAARRLLAD
jgi:hypothetical protein